MAVSTLSGVPASFGQGETVRFSLSDTAFPADEWTGQLLLSRNGTAVTPISSTADGIAHVFVIPAATSANYQPGEWNWQLRFTETATSEKANGAQGILRVTPDLSQNQTASAAQTELAAIQAALLALSTTTNASVNINGTTFSKVNIKDYQAREMVLIARVQAEKRAMGLTAGGSKTIVTRFR